jgi:hypothetical protein
MTIYVFLLLFLKKIKLFYNILLNNTIFITILNKPIYKLNQNHIKHEKNCSFIIFI